MKKRKNYQTILIVLLTLALVIMSIGYANFTRDLKLEGTTTIGSSNWSINFDDASYKESEGSTPATAKTINNTTMSYDVTLEKPGDFYEFTIDVNNVGDFDANLDAITLSSLTEAQKKYLSYKLIYKDQEFQTTTTNLTNIILNKNTGTETVKVRIEYLVPENEADLPTEGEANIKLNATLSYSQVTS